MERERGSGTEREVRKEPYRSLAVVEEEGGEKEASEAVEILQRRRTKKGARLPVISRQVGYVQVLWEYAHSIAVNVCVEG